MRPLIKNSGLKDITIIPKTNQLSFTRNEVGLFEWIFECTPNLFKFDK